MQQESPRVSAGAVLLASLPSPTIPILIAEPEREATSYVVSFVYLQPVLRLGLHLGAVMLFIYFILLFFPP